MRSKKYNNKNLSIVTHCGVMVGIIVILIDLKIIMISLVINLIMELIKFILFRRAQ